MNASRRSPFGTLLREFRERLGFSQEQLAEHAGLSLRGISDLERGLRPTPRLETVRMLAEGLGLNDVQRAELLTARNAHKASQFATHAHELPGLPVPTTSFIGRTAEINAITTLIEGGTARLITLSGPGGVGKTRIAIEAAHRIAGRFPHGAVFVDLASIRDAAMVIPAIADRLGIPGRGEGDIRDVLDVALQGRSMLLVLDNLEQVIDAAIDIAWLLAACPDLTIIATSRILLRIGAEQVMPIEPLALPTYHDVYTFERVDAVALFVARARVADHRFVIDQANAPTVAAIVNRLQGMPLAIELAAARLRLLTIPELLQRLEVPLHILDGGARDVPDRHRTMRETIAWSYDLLSPEEQSVFRTLSIFPDGCLLATAVTVLVSDSRYSETEIVDIVATLVDSSLLRRWEGSDGQARYRMLQTVREFGLEQLVASGEEVVARRAAHSAWCVPLAHRIEFFMCEPDEVYWLNHVAAEYQNLREHLAWLIGNDDIEDALGILGSLSTFRILRWHMEEGRQELEVLLAHPGGQEPTLARMRACIGLGMICNHQAHVAQALDVARAGLALARHVGEPRHQALALNVVSIALFWMGDFEEAEKMYAEEAEIAASIQDSFFIASVLHGRAAIADHRGDLEESSKLLQESLAICQEAGHRWGTALCMGNLGNTALRSGDLDEAERLNLESQEIFNELEGKGGSAVFYLTLAEIARLRLDHEQASAMAEKALAIGHEQGSNLDIAESQLSFARIALHRGDLVTAREHAYQAIHWFNRSGSTLEVVYCLEILADTAAGFGEAGRAAWCIGAVDVALEQYGINRTDIEAGEHQARVAAARVLLSDAEWRVQYARGRAATVAEVLAEVHLWQVRP